MMSSADSNFNSISLVSLPTNSIPYFDVSKYSNIEMTDIGSILSFTVRWDHLDYPQTAKVLVPI